MASKTTAFYRGQMVVWDPERRETRTGGYLEKYGPGPFEVVLVRDVNPDARCAMLAHHKECNRHSLMDLVGHHQWVIIKTSTGERVTMSGAFFLPVAVTDP